ncbi:hypothetical protein [Paenibacillus sp. SI8]|uniref:hypothetical protein n=1 Tax=unclassified Paenibacillus TaxID=185978 RepID=UPI0034677BF2
MSTQQQLKTAFKQVTDQLHPPKQLDAKIEQLFHTNIVDNQAVRSEDTGRKRPFSLFQGSKRKIVILALASMLLLSGAAYASQLLYSLNGKGVQLQVSKESAIDLSHSESVAIYNELQQVKSQLADKQSAFVYLRPLAERQVPALLLVQQPVQYNVLNEWKAAVEAIYPTLKMPTDLPEGYSFAAGQLQNWIGVYSPDEAKSYESKLSKKSQKGSSGITWEKTPDNRPALSSLDSPGLIYRNHASQQLEIRYQIFPQTDGNIQIKGMINEQAKAEPVNLRNQTAGYYVANDNNFSSENGYLQSLQWIENQNNHTILYTISTSSPTIALEDLQKMANSVQ